VPSYFVQLPQVGVSAEVVAPTPRSAKTTYLDYLTRNRVIPWRGRQGTRTGIIVDRIEPGSMAVDVSLSYAHEQAAQADVSPGTGTPEQEQKEAMVGRPGPGRAQLRQSLAGSTKIGRISRGGLSMKSVGFRKRL